MKTRGKLGLIFGTPIAIALILVWIYQTRIQEALDPNGEPIASDESQETIIKEAPFHQGESVHAPDCYVTGCNNTSCHEEPIEKTGCRQDPMAICYEKSNCKLMKEYPDRPWMKCKWEETPEFKECEAKVKEEIRMVNKRFDEQVDKCKYSGKPCTFTYSFRGDNLDFTLPYGYYPIFFGNKIQIRSANDYIEEFPGDSAPYYRIAIDTDEHFIDLSKKSDVEEIQVDGAYGVRYKTKDPIFGVDGWSEAYRLEFNGKFYYFEGYESTMIPFGGEFSDSLKFY